MSAITPAVARAWPVRSGVAISGRAPMVGPGRGIGSQPVVPTGRDLAALIIGQVGSANLKIAVDAGFISSYPGSGQSWIDTVGGNNFNLGASGSGGTDDPTFNGVAGALSSNEYWSFDGGDIFQLASANPPVIESIHKDGAKYTLLFIVNIVSLASPSGAVALCGDHASGTSDVGFLANIGTTIQPGTLGIAVGNGSSTIISPRSSAVTLNIGWNICGVSVDENGGATASKWWANKTNESFNAALTSPSASSASNQLVLGDYQSATAAQRMNANQRLAGFAAFDTNLSTAQLDAIYDAIKSRYGLS
jgi:hypothetical protein